MAKVSAVNRNAKRAYMAQRDKAKRTALKDIIKDRNRPVEERFEASLKLAELPRNGSAVRVRLRCKLTGRPRANYRKFELCRVALRDLASAGQIPGMVKSSW
ncbi:30S ribosomal protein S14 [Acidomonas methanolica]|uniref:Small ribosomal subunit protein uS14 n=1 Tax=Acidomonas methanolica NBRC 104435 TaxID=1231351 RepID=A0A023D6P6_ACIMT|nr:30S ribosomal protein S14 [Acidomonas methanolica]MBU2654699.1 30S ribosomal protein S14 [Acidomonas methanolica]TCS27300.1 small subunit ribosomal protein S14 [Acidomonas methanolica]GAJ29481.1 30S ribosomal protein S14 [Acidomonas methanolica NBRC 104435]GBQ60013.1 30S ribosomal protein S14 [Acidomonas methanolica]GEL00149.1 30S ribosomal protein S14 [Acidomonas methanolica NBRC 104435]